MHGWYPYCQYFYLYTSIGILGYKSCGKYCRWK